MSFYAPEALSGYLDVMLTTITRLIAAARAAKAGAELVTPIADQFYGDRSGRLRDPFGHLWIISTRKEEVSPEETQLRFDAMVKPT